MRAERAVGPAASAPAASRRAARNERAQVLLDTPTSRTGQKQCARQQQECSIILANKRVSEESIGSKERPASGAQSGTRTSSARAHSDAAHMGASRGLAHQLDQFPQVPHQFTQTPHSFNVARSPASSQAAPVFQQTMPADLSLAAPISQQADGAHFNLAAFNSGPTHSSLGGLMAAAAARQQQQQQQQQQQHNLLSQFSNLHSLSAVASAMQRQTPSAKTQDLGAFAAAAAAAAATHFGAPSQHHEQQQQQFHSLARTPAGARKPAGRRRRGARKCRKVYGMAQRALWCTQCKWKKACSRFAVNHAEPVSTTTDFVRRPASAKSRNPPHPPHLQANQVGVANGNHLIRNLLDMSASFQRLQAAVTQPNFRTNTTQL